MIIAELKNIDNSELTSLASDRNFQVRKTNKVTLATHLIEIYQAMERLMEPNSLSSF